MLFNYDFFGKSSIDNNANEISRHTFLQTSYAIEEEDEEDEDTDATNKNKKSIFNIVAVGDWDCTGETEDTVENIIDQDPELVLALGDLSYNGNAECWLELIEPIADKTKIAIGNHEDEDDLTEDYLNYFGLKDQTYSFNYKNIHFLALSTETDYDQDSEQYEFAERDLEKYSKDPFIDWIIVYYHRHIYGSGPGLDEETDFRETYHPLFDKYKVDIALQGHLHVYERTYPITFNTDDDGEPLVQDYSPNIYKNPKGPIFVTAGTGGAHAMILSSLGDYSAKGIDGKFGILDIALEADQKTLTGTFIENGKKKEIMDEFKIIKE
jgi:Calcineurin-like phosphoesterase